MTQSEKQPIYVFSTISQALGANVCESGRVDTPVGVRLISQPVFALSSTDRASLRLCLRE